MWVRVRLPFVNIFILLLSNSYNKTYWSSRFKYSKEKSTNRDGKGEHHAIHLYWLHKWYFLTRYYSVTFINSLSMLSFNFICEIYCEVEIVHTIYDQNKIILFLKSNLNNSAFDNFFISGYTFFPIILNYCNFHCI